MKPARLALRRPAARCAASGCSRLEPWVKPYEREDLADPIMAWDRDPVSSSYMLPRVRVARRRARRRGRRRRRLRMQLIRRIARSLCSCCRSRRSPGVLPDDRADLHVPLLRRRRRHHRRPVAAGAQEVRARSTRSAPATTWTWSRRASIDVITTASPYKEERTQYGVGFEYLRGKVTYAASLQQQRERLQRRHREPLDQPGHVRRPDDGLAVLHARLGRRLAPRRRRRSRDQVDRRIYGVDVSQIATKNLILGLSFETITEEGFLNNPVPPGAVRGPGRGARLSPTRPSAIRARARATRSRCAAAGTCRIARRSRATTASTPIPGTSAARRPKSATRIRSARSGPSTSTTASTRRTPRTSTRTCSRARTSRTSWRATRNSPSMKSQHARLRRRLRVQAGPHRVPGQGVAQPALRPDPVRLRRLPRPARHGRRARHRAALQLRRGRHPLVLLRLVLRRRPSPFEYEHLALRGHDDRVARPAARR